MTAAGAEAGSDLVPADPAFPVTGEGSETSRAPDTRPRTWLIRATIEGVLAVPAVVAAWLLLEHGIRTDNFPPFLAGEPSTPITRYSGPWLTAAAGMALVAALLLIFAVRDLVRWSAARKASPA